MTTPTHAFCAVLAALCCMLSSVSAGDYAYTISYIGSGHVTITKYTGPGGVVRIPGAIEGWPVTSIGSAFSRCTNLTDVTIPPTITSIGSSAFQGCTGLTSVTIPDSVTTIGNFAFASCTSLTSITIPDSVTIFGTNAFASCTGLTSIYLTGAFTSIGDGAFDHCTSLTSITYGSPSGAYSRAAQLFFCKSFQDGFGG